MLDIHRPEDTRTEDEKSSDFLADQFERKRKRELRELKEKAKSAKLDIADAQQKAGDLRLVIKKLERELANFDEDKLDEDDPFIQVQLEQERIKADRWKISDTNWRGIVGIIGTGVIVFLIMMVNSVFATMLGADEGEE